MEVKTGHLIVVHGATAVGKTSTAVALAQGLNCDILSCDSRQFYREMSIGTAVPTPAELAAARHHFVHDRSVLEPISAGGYEMEALELLDKLFQTQSHAVMVGGSGLYAAAVTQGFDDLPKDDKVREELNKKSIEELQEMLKELDPCSAQKVDLQNRRRLQRAVEVCIVSGKPCSQLRSGEQKQRPFRITEIVVDRTREELYDRINQRVDIMIEQGLEQEAHTLLPHRSLQALQTVGYREFFDYFDGKTDLTEATRLIKQNTRHYAKRQLTWLRSKDNLTYFDPSQIDRILAVVR